MEVLKVTDARKAEIRDFILSEDNSDKYYLKRVKDLGYRIYLPRRSCFRKNHEINK